MAKLILRCNYLKDAPPKQLEHLIRYIATREGVEKVSSTNCNLPATAAQKNMVKDIVKNLTHTGQMHEYYDYLNHPTRGNASEFITQALEQNLDLIGKRKNYIDYLGNRPGVERQGTHGLFSDSGKAIILSQVAEEAANHKGILWTNIISLRREDAERLGYDTAEQWMALLRSRKAMLCKNYKIDSRNLQWYAAFHNASHHPHVHLVVYSENPSEGYLSKTAIENMRSELAHAIFRQDIMHIYERQNKWRTEVKSQTENRVKELAAKMQEGICENLEIADKMVFLSMRLQKTKGKKVYGYLKADVKKVVDNIVDALEKDPLVAECYSCWQEANRELLSLYSDRSPESQPLSTQKELKSIKNMVISYAAAMGNQQLNFPMEEKDEVNRLNSIGEAEEQGWENGQQEGNTAGQDTSEEEIPELKEKTYLIPYSFKDKINMPDCKDGKCYLKWTALYKEARTYLYGTDDCDPDFETAYSLLKREAERGNALAKADLGKMFEQGMGRKADAAQALIWYREALQNFIHLYQTGKEKDSYLVYRIGKMYQMGQGTETDCAEAARWYQEAADDENQYARYSLAGLYYRGEGVDQNFDKAFHYYRLSAEQGNAYAAYETAKMYRDGISVAVEKEKADFYFRQAFQGFLAMKNKSRDDLLLYRIGQMYLTGTGTEKNEQKAEWYLEKSARLKNIHARYQLAKLYLLQEKRKLDKNPAVESAKQPETINYQKVNQAKNWLEESLEEGNLFAAYALGKLYADGELVEKDSEKAFRYLTLSADDENPYACYRLGKLYLETEPKDVGKALFYLHQAAEKNLSQASCLLGRMYLTGEEIKKDTELAVKWLTKSSEEGNSFAQYLLGRYYLTGWKGKKEEELAFYWLQKSAEQGNIYAAYLLEHWGEYQPDALLAATRLVRQLGEILEGPREKKQGEQTMVDRKLRRKMREKKILQGHAADDNSMLYFH